MTGTNAVEALLPRDPPEHVVVILSGGLDSTVLSYRMRAEGCRLTMLSFDYGQPHHRRRLEYARRTAARLTGVHRVVDLSEITAPVTRSLSTSSPAALPDGRHNETSKAATLVPNRNAIMLDVAVAQAVAIRADAVAFSLHADDHTTYPDSRPRFVDVYRRMMKVANQGSLHPRFLLLAPFLRLSKAAIVRIGAELKVPLAETWSCNTGGESHCGTCDTCVERRKAFQQAEITDPTVYEQEGG